ncbi:acetate uptake transporter [Nitratifractor salsuginis]|uniref:GPR1/FUN34/yaaH family protein n=1 Tax=Nitratifractor salsuginis (strain DSM 16511 / JCM 12458 / E9I37-1) TaxID=749222 RepID=E6WXR3_NITSE|nr:GPR1/FUN34/YaaH family transporter [Nitratifractor salsuginis]ADV46320.1 GPR1/FUN34/yaaH family protein [Nitratifractor salsuginis DSM 16511]
MEQVKLGNPAAVGLAGFAMTTFLLQCHNLGWIGVGPVLWLGLFYGGLAQFIAGFLEFKVGNNFGFSAFVSYGAFWMALALFLIFGTSPETVKAYPLLKLTTPEVAYFLLAWTIYTGIMFIGSMKVNGTLAFVFLTLFLGFLGLTIKDMTGNHLFGTLAAWDLMVCAAAAWYLMAHVIFEGVGIHLPVGKAWL